MLDNANKESFDVLKHDNKQFPQREGRVEATDKEQSHFIIELVWSTLKI